MTDFLDLARESRAFLEREIALLDRFIATAEALRDEAAGIERGTVIPFPAPARPKAKPKSRAKGAKRQKRKHGQG